MPERKVDFGHLADWVEGRLSDEEARSVEATLAAADEAARAEAEWLRAFNRASEDIVLDTPPREVRSESLRRFEAYAEDRRSPGLLRRFVARISFEGGMQPAFGVRSASAQEGQIVYTTEAADVALNVRRRPGGQSLNLDGQVFPTDDADPGSYSIQLLRGVEELGLAATDALGEFTFESIPPGEYQIFVSGEQVEILISAIELRP
ncbi:MAG: hypothetical protein ACRDTR_10010 [Rubrobacter sp.]